MTTRSTPKENEQKRLARRFESRNFVRHKAAGETIAELRIELQEAATENGRLIARLAEASSAAASTAEQIESINEVILATGAQLESLDERLQATLEELHLLDGGSQA